MKFILGTKLNMTQVFRPDGTVVPVTRVQAGPCVVTQVKTDDEKNAVQIGYGKQKKFRLSKPILGHLKGIKTGKDESITVRVMRDFQTDEDHGLQRGDTFTVKIFEAGEKVQVSGEAKGKGFQGVVKRHGFHGAPASHGHKDQLRMPGSIGATGPARVFKGTRMPGHMGTQKVTVKNLEIMEVHEKENELLIKGAIPGARGSLLLISTPEGKIEIGVEEKKEKKVEKKEEPVKEEKKEEPKKEEKVEKPAEKKIEVVKAKEKPVEEKKEEPKKEN